VRKAYRRLSLVLHPDKNDAEDAEVKFRHLAAVYEVLKDKERRAVYDRVLVEGLPDWRTPAFYYRRMRKIGLAEGLAYLFAIFTVCQYFVNWAAYLERRFTLREALATQEKRLQKRAGKNKEEQAAIKKVMEQEELNLLGPRPTCFDTLPFQLARFAKWLALVGVPGLPAAVMGSLRAAKERKEEAQRQVQAEEDERKRKEEEKERKKEQKAKRKRVERWEDRTGQHEEDKREAPPEAEDVFHRPANALQMWTDADLAKLARLMKKFPAGAHDRWERIAEAMQRLPWEVAKMAQKVKEVAYQVPISKGAQGVTGLESQRLVQDDRLEHQKDDDDDQSEEEGSEEASETDDENYGVYTVAGKEEYTPVEVKSKKKTKGGKHGEEDEEGRQGEGEEPVEDPWSQQQQKALELALMQFPKGTAERWERISGKVPGKSKEQCMVRFKSLAEAIKKKKECSGSGPSQQEAQS